MCGFVGYKQHSVPHIDIVDLCSYHDSFWQKAVKCLDLTKLEYHYICMIARSKLFEEGVPFCNLCKGFIWPLHLTFIIHLIHIQIHVFYTSRHTNPLKISRIMQYLFSYDFVFFQLSIHLKHLCMSIHIDLAQFFKLLRVVHNIHAFI